MTSPLRIASGLWWDRSWSLVSGCSPVTTGCDHCWLAREAHMRAGQKNEKIRARYASLTNADGRWTGEVRVHPELLDLPRRTRKPQTWAVWSDLFHPAVTDDQICRVLAMMAYCSRQTFVVLTKRPERMHQVLTSARCGERYAIYYHALNGAYSPVLVPSRECPNIYLGISAHDQASFDTAWTAVAHLAAAGWRIALSAEPLLGAIDLHAGMWGEGRPRPIAEVQAMQLAGGPLAGLVGVIVGGESGPGARPTHPDWVRGLRDQCEGAGVPFFFKQWGEWAPGEHAYSSPMHVWPDGARSYRVGKRRAGRLLDGRTWDDLPWQAPEEVCP